MIKERCIALMNILASLIGYIDKSSLPFRLIHGLVGFEAMEESVRKEMRALFDKSAIDTSLKKGLELACENQVDIAFAPEMLGTAQTERRVGNYNEFAHHVYSDAALNDNKPPLITIMPSYWEKGVNSAAIVYRDGRILGRQRKYTPYIDYQSCSIEGIKQEQIQEIYLIHIYGVHRIVISICAEFLGGFDSDFICGQLGATLVIVPSFSHGERDFVNKLGALFPYGTSVVWGDCCGAVDHSPKIIGGYSLVGSNEIHEMGHNCKCGFECGCNKGCLFTVELPLKVLYSKAAGLSNQPFQHILTNNT